MYNFLDVYTQLYTKTYSYKACKHCMTNCKSSHQDLQIIIIFINFEILMSTKHQYLMALSTYFIFSLDPVESVTGNIASRIALLPGLLRGVPCICDT